MFRKTTYLGLVTLALLAGVAVGAGAIDGPADHEAPGDQNQVADIDDVTMNNDCPAKMGVSMMCGGGGGGGDGGTILAPGPCVYCDGDDQ